MAPVLTAAAGWSHGNHRERSRRRPPSGHGTAERHNARCGALIASGRQPSDAPTVDSMSESISLAVRRFGTRGCAGRMAQEFGDHPEVVAGRMRWARQFAAGAAARRPASRARVAWPAPQLAAREVTTQPTDGRR